MKLSQDKYELLKRMIHEFALHVGFDKCKEQAARLSPMRYRWDLFYSAARTYKHLLPEDIYSDGINDDHLDTAFRRIVKELGL